MEAILQDMDALGYVGEEKAKALLYLVGVSRKQDRPLSAVVLSESGAGKSSLAELVESLTPPEDVMVFTRLSTQALSHMPNDALCHKLLILEERVGAEAADYQIRILQSRQQLASGVVVKNALTGEMKTRALRWKGRWPTSKPPPTPASTTKRHPLL